VALGASPRASLGLLRAAKGHAVLAGRAYLTPDDVRAVATGVLAHRLVVIAESDDEAALRASVVASALRDVRYRRSVRPV
jgi:MoxR-like ATPase